MHRDTLNKMQEDTRKAGLGAAGLTRSTTSRKMFLNWQKQIG